jgi:hypothetical protein
MGSEYKEDCVFCPDHARKLREAEKGTDDCVIDGNGIDRDGLIDIGTQGG